MDWVEEKYQRQQLISDQAGRIWESLCIELKTCVESYNRRFGTNPVQPVECDAIRGVIKIRKVIASGEPRHAQFSKESTIDLSIVHEGNPRIVAVISILKPGAPGSLSQQPKDTREFVFDADAAKAFLAYQGKQIEIGEASRVILEQFLFG